MEKSQEALKLFSIQTEGSVGTPTNIYRGEQTLPLLTEKLFSLYNQEGNLLENLLQHKVKSQEVDEYLATDQGQSQLIKLLSWITIESKRKLNKL